MPARTLQFEGRKKLNKSVDLTPLIDVIFQLLLFFMLTSVIAAKQGLNLSLPQASQISPLPKQAIEVEINKLGEVYISGNQVLDENLETHFKSLLKSPDQSKVIIRSDAEVSVSKLVSILDTVKGLGVSDLSIAASAKVNNSISKP